MRQRVNSTGDKTIKLAGKIVNEFGDGEGLVNVNINGKLAYSLFEGSADKEKTFAGDSTIVLWDFYGEWIDETGRKVTGCLKYIPK